MNVIPIVQGIVTYILANPPQTFAQISARAMTKPWYTANTFYAVMERVGRDPRISATVHGGDIVYTLKRAAPKRIQEPRTPCPPLIPGVNDAVHDIFINMCFCYLSCPKGGADVMWEKWEKKVHKEGCFMYA